MTGAQVDYNGSPAGYTAAPGEAVTYVDAHDNEILYDALAFKLPAGTSPADRARMQVLALSLRRCSGRASGSSRPAPSGCGPSRWTATRYNSGDWFNAIRWDSGRRATASALGLPPAADNQDKWPYAGPLLADPALVPDCGRDRAGRRAVRRAAADPRGVAAVRPAPPPPRCRRR